MGTTTVTNSTTVHVGQYSSITVLNGATVGLEVPINVSYSPLVNVSNAGTLLIEPYSPTLGGPAAVSNTVAVGSVSNYGMITATNAAQIGTLENAGTMVVDAPVTITGDVGAPAPGVIDVGSGGTLVLQGDVASGETIAFTGPNGVVTATSGDFLGTITGFSQGDTLDLSLPFLSGVETLLAGSTVSGTALVSLFSDLHIGLSQGLSAALAQDTFAFTQGSSGVGVDLAITSGSGTLSFAGLPNAYGMVINGQTFSAFSVLSDVLQGFSITVPLNTNAPAGQAITASGSQLVGSYVSQISSFLEDNGLSQSQINALLNELESATLTITSEGTAGASIVLTPGSLSLGVTLPQNSGTFAIDGTLVPLYTLTGPITISPGGYVGDDGQDATLITAISFSAPGTITAAPNTTITANDTVWGYETVDLFGNVDAPRFGFVNAPSFGNTGTVFVGGADDTIGAVTNDVLVVAGTTTALTFLGGTGAATVFGGGGGGLIEGGGGGGNVLVATGGATTVLGGLGGSDTLVAGGGTSMLAATPNDLVFASAGNSTVFGAASGSDTLVGGDSGSATLVGSTGDDAMWGGLGQDILFGGTGNETLGGGAGNTTVVAGTGASTLVGGSGNQVFVGAASGQATAFSGTGNSVLFTGGENMLAVLQNQPGTTDTVVLQSGNATIWGGAGADVYDVINGTAGGNALIEGFKPGTDMVNLYGYNSASVYYAGGNTSLVLSDNTTITFAGLFPSQVSSSIILR